MEDLEWSLPPLVPADEGKTPSLASTLANSDALAAAAAEWDDVITETNKSLLAQTKEQPKP